MIQMPISWELYTATVILVISIAVVFMLLRYAAIIRTLQETQDLLLQLVGVVDPRALLEMDLPPEHSAAEGGELEN